MNVLGGSPRVDITISVNPQFELRLDHASIQQRAPTAADFDGNWLEIGHARFSIFSEVGEITTGALLYMEYPGKDRQAEAPWRLVVVPRPALEPLAEAMRKLLMAEAGEAMRRRAEVGAEVRRRLVDS
jgi:hypothetical protein